MSELTLANLKDLVLRLGLNEKLAVALRDIGDSMQTCGTQELTVTGAVDAGTRSIELNHASTIVAATMTAPANGGLVVIKDTSASGTAAHTCTVSGGTFDGTNNTVTLNAPAECIIIFFDSAGAGTIVENVGTVALSSV